MDVTQRKNGTWSLDWQNSSPSPVGPFITLTSTQFWALVRELRKLRLVPEKS